MWHLVDDDEGHQRSYQTAHLIDEELVRDELALLPLGRVCPLNETGHRPKHGGAQPSTSIGSNR